MKPLPMPKGVLSYLLQKHEQLLLFHSKFTTQREDIDRADGNLGPDLGQAQNCDRVKVKS